MSTSELNEILGPIEGTALERALSFWVEIGVLRETTAGKFIVLEERDGSVPDDSPIFRDGAQRSSLRLSVPPIIHISNMLFRRL